MSETFQAPVCASTVQRMVDLIRHQRAELHEAELITDDEYAALATAKGSVDRLESYDDVRSQLTTALARAERAEKACAEWALGVTQSNTDIVDMQRDEFRRIIALNPSDEIKGICERAIKTIEQTVPVVVQRDRLETRNRQLVQAMEEAVKVLEKVSKLCLVCDRCRDRKDKAIALLKEMGKEGFSQEPNL